MSKTAVGILVRDRWDLTHQTLMSLYYTDQPKDSYDVFIVDNASSENDTIDELKKFVASGLLPIKNAYFLPTHMAISQAWNLFLGMTQNYDQRVILDNDVAFLRTVSPPSTTDVKRDVHGIPESSPEQVDPLAGAPRSGAVIGGVNSITSRLQRPSAGIYARNEGVPSSIDDKSSRFLDHLSGFSRENDVDIVSLVPVPPRHVFSGMYDKAINNQFNGRPFLTGGCMLISKRAFDTLGFFDERLDRRIDIEYTQRAIRNHMNIGYHPSYWVVHLGADQVTEGQDQYTTKMAQATSALQTMQLHSTHVSSMWDGVLYQIKSASKKNVVVNIT